jgi:uncharacterized membrane protein
MFCHSCGTQVNASDSFCPSCGASLISAAPPSPGPVWTPHPGITAHTGQWIGEGWDMVKDDLGVYIALALVTFVLGSMVPFIIQGPLTAGFFIFCMKRSMNRRAEFSDLFNGFNFFIPALLASLVIAAFVAIGTLLCIIPGIVVAASCKFTYLFIVDKRMDFWQAMEASHAVVKNDYFGFSMFLIALTLLNVLGFICCLVGTLVTMPITVAAITVAYRDIVGFDPRNAAAV